MRKAIEVYVGLPERSEHSIESKLNLAIYLIKAVMDAYIYHPYFTMLRSGGDPPLHPFLHQVELLLKTSFRRPVRLLLGDEIGLGKTIEAILVTLSLIDRWGGRRILILVPRILVDQWVSELMRFNLNVKVLEGKDLERLQANLQEGFYVVSVDLAKKPQYMDKVVSVNWDVVVVDEAHRISVTRGIPTQRYQLVRRLAERRDLNLILLSATPHRGYVEDYLERLRLVDPHLVEDVKLLDSDEFYRLKFNSIVFRRTKLDVNEVYERREVFRGCKFVARVIRASELEEEFYEKLLSFLRRKLQEYHYDLGEKPRALPLLLTIIAKRASSSPYAGMLTLERVLERRARIITSVEELDREAESIVESYLGVGFEDYSLDNVVEPDKAVEEFVGKCGVMLNERDLGDLRELLELAKRVVNVGDTRLKALVDILKDRLSRGERVVVFTEYKDTATYIYRRLRELLPEYRDDIALITSDGVKLPGWVESRSPTIEDLKEYLRRGRVKVVVSTDVASEGLNLQVASVLVNYEPSWSPVKIEQRIGRVWRLGQERDVTAYTLLLAVDIDVSVVEVLYKKLLALGRALRVAKTLLGEEVEIDMRSRDGSLVVPEVTPGSGGYGFSEYKAIVTYLKYGRDGLANYVDSIKAAISNLKMVLEKAGLTRRADSLAVDRLVNEVLGGFKGLDVEESLAEMFTAVAELQGYNVERREGRIYAGRYIASNLNDIYENLMTIVERFKEGGVKPPFCLTSIAKMDYERLYLVKATVSLDKTLIYSEPVGLGVLPEGSMEVVRGPKLLKLVANTIRAGDLKGKACNVDEKTLVEVNQRAIKVLRRILDSVTRELLEYVRGVENRRLSSTHGDWRPKDLNDYVLKAEPIAVIEYSIKGGVEAETIQLIKRVVGEYDERRFEVEREAIAVLKSVISRDYEVQDVHDRGWSYDLILVRRGEVEPKEHRIVEVKTWKHVDPRIGNIVIYTGGEREYAEDCEKRDVNYWLYIVDLRGQQPRILAYKHPFKNNALKHVATIEKNAKRYHVYEVVGEATD